MDIRGESWHIGVTRALTVRMVHEFAKTVLYHRLKGSPFLEEIEDRSTYSSCSRPKGIVEGFVLIVIMRRRFIFFITGR